MDLKLHVWNERLSIIADEFFILIGQIMLDFFVTVVTTSKNSNNATPLGNDALRMRTMRMSGINSKNKKKTRNTDSR